MKYYLQPEKYFHGKVCKGDCRRTIESVFKQDKPPKDIPYVYYCDFGNSAMEIDPDTTEWKNKNCDYVICKKCYDKKGGEIEALNGGGTGRGRRSTRSKRS